MTRLKRLWFVVLVVTALMAVGATATLAVWWPGDLPRPVSVQVPPLPGQSPTPTP